MGKRQVWRLDTGEWEKLRQSILDHIFISELAQPRRSFYAI